MLEVHSRSEPYVRGPASCQFMGKCEQSISDVETGTQLSGTEPFGPDCFI